MEASLLLLFKKTVLDIAACTGVKKTCHEFGVARSTFYEWKARYDREGVKGSTGRNQSHSPNRESMGEWEYCNH